MMESALIIFTRNPELGKCKTRLAKTIGDKAALDVYIFLLQHTANISKKINAQRFVFYSDTIEKKDIWSNDHFNKNLQHGKDLGERMYNAFQHVFAKGIKKAVIIGSDLLDLSPSIINTAFQKLDQNDAVIGPAQDGGYYLLGLNELNSEIFKNKNWGTETVLQDTLDDLKYCSVYMLEELNDIDTFEDMQHYDQLKKFYAIK